MTAPTETELKHYHCEERSALGSNGGRISTTEIITKVANNVWPHVLRGGREIGEILYRGIALKIHQDDTSGTLATTEFCLDGPTLGEDRAVLFAKGPRDTQDDITGSERFYCAASLATAIVAGTKTIVANVKDAADAAGIAEGDDFRFTDKLTPDSTTGNVEYHTVDTLSVSGTQLTITTVETIANSYAAYSAGVGGKLGVIYSAGETKAYNDTPTITTAGDGDYDFASYPVIYNNMGADEQIITIEMTDASSFTVESDRHGVLASGSKGSDYTVLHPYWGKSMFLIEADGWSGTWAAGDKMVIPMHGASTHCWEKRIVPAGCASLSSNRIILVNRAEGL
jgi:hypothetical protein